MKKKKRRTRQEVKDDILAAVGNTLKKHGYAKLGVAVVAEEAGMDKAMLYRHYDNFEDILRAFIAKEDFWLKSLEGNNNTSCENHIEFLQNIFIAQFQELMKNEKLQQLLLWELSDKYSIMKDVAMKREQLAEPLLLEYKDKLKTYGVKANNILAIISAGVYYLVLHKNRSTFCWLDLNDSLQQKEFINDMSWLIEQIFSIPNNLSETERIALNCITKGFSNDLILELTGLSIERIEKLRKH
jgi:AcrR family transcriptional regulator